MRRTVSSNYSPRHQRSTKVMEVIGFIAIVIIAWLILRGIAWMLR